MAGSRLFLPINWVYLSSVLAVVVLALAAAALYAVSGFLEPRVAHRTAVELGGRDHAGVLPTVRAGALVLVRNRIWVLGWLVGTLAYRARLALFAFSAGLVIAGLTVLPRSPLLSNWDTLPDTPLEVGP